MAGRNLQSPRGAVATPAVDRQRTAAMAGPLGPSAAPGTEPRRHSVGVSGGIGGTDAPSGGGQCRTPVHPPSQAARRVVSFAGKGSIFWWIPFDGASGQYVLYPAGPAA